MRRPRLVLAISEWPQEDQLRWNERIAGDLIFGPKGRNRLSPHTMDGRRQSYGRMLGFLKAEYPERLSLPLSERIDLPMLRHYADEMQKSCRETTIAIELERIYFVVRTLAPETDFRWLLDVARRVEAQATRLTHRYVTSSDLYALGLELMDRADLRERLAGRVPVRRALLFRDGLIIAALAEAPIRRGAFSALQLETHVRKTGVSWWIDVPGHLTKTKTPQSYCLSQRLSTYMDTYVRLVRPNFPGASQHLGFWPTWGRPMSARAISNQI